jgi:hypothetical protein
VVWKPIAKAFDYFKMLHKKLALHFRGLNSSSGHSIVGLVSVLKPVSASFYILLVGVFSISSFSFSKSIINVNFLQIYDLQL